MGLDMYLYKRRYVKNWEHDKDNKWSITVKHNDKELKNELPVSYVTYDAGYWRKANAIHKWFVDNCGGGEDNCQSMYVDKEDLLKLQGLCKEVLRTAKTEVGQVVNGYRVEEKDGEIVRIPNYQEGITVTNPEQLAEILPTEEGFFFGSTDYNEYYLDDVRETVEIIDKALAEDYNCDYEYRASW